MKTLYLKAADPPTSHYRQHEQAEALRPFNYVDYFRPPLLPGGEVAQLPHSPNTLHPGRLLANLRRLRGSGADVFFATSPSLHVVLAHYAGLVRGRYVLLCWATAQRSRLHRWLFAQQLRLARRILVNDSRTREQLVRDWAVPAVRIVWLPFGIDADYFVPVAEPARRHLLVPGDAVRDEAFVLELAAAGLGPVVRGIKDEGIRDFYAAQPPWANPVEVRWLRPFSEIRANYQHARAVIIPVRNDREPSGLTALLEGMACGRPCLINEGRTTADYVEDGVTGFVLKGPRGTWLEQVRRILQDAGALERVGQQARARVMARHAIPQVHRLWIKALTV
jgi:glycosyltransferase involved in cell wall biosynthesis